MSLMRPFNHSTLSGMGGEYACPRCRPKSCLILSTSFSIPRSTMLIPVIRTNPMVEQRIDRQINL